MKIGIVSPYDYCSPGGVVLHISYLAHHFLKMGHEVKVIAPLSRKCPGYFGEEVIGVGYPVPWPNSGSIARIPISPWLGIQTKRVLDRERFDVLHMHEPFTPMLALSALQLSRTVNVGTFHAYHTKARGYWLGKPILKRAQKRLHRQIAVSPAALKFVARHLPDDFVIIPNGVDTERFNMDAPVRPDLRNGKLNILFVGRLERRKGVNYLLDAFAEVKQKLPNTQLTIVGPGQVLLNEYQKTVEDKHIEDVKFVGFVPSNELPAYYRSADVFCAPALYGESFGIVLLEAMATGTPVVASDIEGYNAVLGHEKEGLLVPPRDPTALAGALLKVLRDDKVRMQYGKAGLEKAQQFSWAHVAAQVMDCYQDAIRIAGR